MSKGVFSRQTKLDKLEFESSCFHMSNLHKHNKVKNTNMASHMSCITVACKNNNCGFLPVTVYFSSLKMKYKMVEKQKGVEQVLYFKKSLLSF